MYCTLPSAMAASAAARRIVDGSWNSPMVVHRPVADEDPHACRVGDQWVAGGPDQIEQRPLRHPRRADDLDAVSNVDRVGAVQDDDVRRDGAEEGRRAVHRRGIERVVVAGKEEDRYRDGGHRLKGPTDRPGSYPVRLEDVAGHHHELGLLGGRHPADRGQAIDPRLGIPRLRVVVEEAPGHPELEIRGVDEANRYPPFPRPPQNTRPKQSVEQNPPPHPPTSGRTPRRQGGRAAPHPPPSDPREGPQGPRALASAP